MPYKIPTWRTSKGFVFKNRVKTLSSRLGSWTDKDRWELEKICQEWVDLEEISRWMNVL